MDYRESPGISAGSRLEGGVDDQAEPRRFRRFDFVRPQRQLDVPRVVLAVGLIGMAAVLAVYLVTMAVRSAVSWLHLQSQYQIQFADIALAEPPPAWFRGGRETFLRKVRENADEPEILPLLDLERGRIDRAFRLSPFVEDVIRVEYPPHQIIVHLVYKQPIATLPFPRSPALILDRNAHVLPREDIDLDKLDPLIEVIAQGLLPSAAKPGLPFRPPGSSPESDRCESCIRQATSLAAYFREPPRARAASSPALRITKVIATECIAAASSTLDHRGFFVANADRALILWGQPPGEEPPGAAKADDKWAILEKWATGPVHEPLPDRDFWSFTPTYLDHIRTAPASGHASTPANPGR